MFSTMCMSAACILLRHWVNLVNAKAGRRYLVLSVFSFVAFLHQVKKICWFCPARDSNQVLELQVLSTLPMSSSHRSDSDAFSPFACFCRAFCALLSPVSALCFISGSGLLDLFLLSEPKVHSFQTACYPWCIFSQRLDQVFNSLCMSSKVLYPFPCVAFSFRFLQPKMVMSPTKNSKIACERGTDIPGVCFFLWQALPVLAEVAGLGSCSI